MSHNRKMLEKKVWELCNCLQNFVFDSKSLLTNVIYSKNSGKHKTTCHQVKRLKANKHDTNGLLMIISTDLKLLFLNTFLK